MKEKRVVKKEVKVRNRKVPVAAFFGICPQKRSIKKCLIRLSSNGLFDIDTLVDLDI